MRESTLEIDRKAQTAWVWMNRPEVHNAFDAKLVNDLTEAFLSLGSDSHVRAIVLCGRGKSFSAGAQAEWMRQQGSASFAENLEDARQLGRLFHTIATTPVPTIARVQGAAIGGGIGLVCACDIAIASHTAIFATSEVRLGLIPSVIAPYVIRALGERQAHRYFLTAERIDVARAHQLGLVHDVASAEELDACVGQCLAMLLAGAPGAQREAKLLLEGVAKQTLSEIVIEDTAQRIARRRSHSEATEGLNAFLSKRPASWVAQP